MSNQFFDQDFTKTHSDTKSAIKSKSIMVALYDDNLAELEELSKLLAERAGKNPNRSTAARTAITYTLQQLKKDEKKLLDIYYRAGSRR